MSCSTCGSGPCGCHGAPVDPCNDGVCFVDVCQPVNEDPACTTKCNLNKTNNIWYVPDQPGYDCKCKLDNMTYGQVINVLESIPYANKQLEAITDDPCLLMLAREIKLKVPEQEDDAIAQDRINRNTLPYYTVFRGNTGGDAGRRTRSR